jgi:hypothetical protein
MYAEEDSGLHSVPVLDFTFGSSVLYPLRCPSDQVGEIPLGFSFNAEHAPGPDMVWKDRDGLILVDSKQNQMDSNTCVDQYIKLALCEPRPGLIVSVRTGMVGRNILSREAASTTTPDPEVSPTDGSRSNVLSSGVESDVGGGSHWLMAGDASQRLVLVRNRCEFMIQQVQGQRPHRAACWTRVLSLFEKDFKEGQALLSVPHVMLGTEAYGQVVGGVVENANQQGHVRQRQKKAARRN